MTYYFKMAWRNIWRNKRRTLITAASILFAVFFAIFMRAIQLGSYGNMVDNVVQAYTGYIQIFDHRYQEDKVIDHSIDYKDGLLDKIEAHSNVTIAVPRLESFALASSGTKTKGIMLVGTDPARDDELTNLSGKIVEGEYLKEGDTGLLVSQRLASYLKAGIGDTIVLISQGYHGIGAADQYKVQGIIKFPSPDLDNKMIFMDLGLCQEFYSAPDLISSVSLNLDNDNRLNQTVKDLQKSLGEQYEVKSWKTILTKLVQQIEGDNAGGILMLVLLYMIVGFGIFGTVQMMTTERRKEFGVMVAVGMQKTKLGGILIIEMLLIGILGTLAGIVLSIPVVYEMYIHPITLSGEVAESIMSFGMEPIMPTAWEAGYFFSQAGVVLIIVSIAIFFPILGVTRLKVNKALRA
ncbi:MAG: ABC transporter permease [Bacteroidetes bacterium]|jgi:ABC-type lipoprotein release transport system permease subunit|nr:ABC transporter permease [Bacteroidota bacterium]MBT4399011.1 ABC transporter permease [Bacteroidota bacterium]MBT4409481.1 ABC transporter permease [Bacteroidota bacterium]MBT5426704.1 ABC transporter permease [Bacteroidota bacterium]MBT7092935.1 ABC transporter permease [Bacteroidota bacterium]